MLGWDIVRVVFLSQKQFYTFLALSIVAQNYNFSLV